MPPCLQGAYTPKETPKRVRLTWKAVSVKTINGTETEAPVPGPSQTVAASSTGRAPETAEQVKIRELEEALAVLRKETESIKAAF